MTAKIDFRRIGARTALAAGGIFVAMALCEVVLRFARPDYVPSAGTERSFFARFDPVLGWAPVTNFSARHERSGFSVFAHQNQFGLRGPDSMTLARSGLQRRVLVLGDSYVWGFGANQNELFTDPLVHRSEVEWINAGVSGYGTDQEYLFYSRDTARFDVDEVMLVLTPYNDVENNLNDRQYDRAKPFYTIENGRLVLHTRHIRYNPFSTYMNALRLHSRVLNRLDGGNRRITNWLTSRRQSKSAAVALDQVRDAASISEQDRAGVHLTAKITAALRDAAAARGAAFSVVFIPYKPHIQARVDRNHPLVPLLAEELKAAGIACMDPYSTFLREAAGGRVLFNRFDAHFSADGHALFARCLADPALWGRASTQTLSKIEPTSL